MERKKLIKILYPPIWTIFILILLCTAALTYIFLGGYEKHPLAYLSYTLSFYALTVTVIMCIRILPKHFRSAKKRIYENPIGNRYMTDMSFRTHISLYGSLGINLLYAVMNIISGVMYRSAWFYNLAFYYSILAVMRFLLVRFVNRTGIGKNRYKELCCSCICGYILLILIFALSGAVFMILYRNKGFVYNGIMIYVMALYAFWSISFAIVNLVKNRKFGSPIMSMAKTVNMAAALVSMLSLETAMFSEFEGMPPEGQRLMTALTGAGVSIIVISMSVYSIVKNSKEIKQIKENKGYGK